VSYITIIHHPLNNAFAHALEFEYNEELSNDAEACLIFESKRSLVPQKLLGTSLSLEVKDESEYVQHYLLYITKLTCIAQSNQSFKYKLNLNSGLYFLKKHKTCKIYQDCSIIEVITQVLKKYSFIDYSFTLMDNYQNKEYCVQFLETDYDFINRLMENEGIWYYMQQEKGKHILIITDSYPFPELNEQRHDILFITDNELVKNRLQGITKFSHETTLDFNEVVLNDYDYLVPEKKLKTHLSEHDFSRHDNRHSLFWSDYAPGYSEHGQGEKLARIRLEEILCSTRQYHGEGSILGLAAGKRFQLRHHPDNAMNRNFNIIKCHYIFKQSKPDSRHSGNTISCDFTVLDDDTHFRPQRKTPVSNFSGIHSAIVVGPEKSEVYTDKLGRIKVHFHWDVLTGSTDDSSCWIRVSQAWAGKGWGMMALPRVGQEVLVGYMDGNINKPVIIGAVYNGDKMPPWPLPENSNLTGIVSRSLSKGTVHQSNYLTFDDKSEGERILFHSERDLHETVEHNKHCHIGNNLFKQVSGVTYNTYTEQITTSSYDFNFTGSSLSLTGVSLAATGVNQSITGLNNEFTTISNSFVISDNSVVGIDISCTGVEIEVTGIANEANCLHNEISGQHYEVTGQHDEFIELHNSMVNTENSVTVVSNNFTGNNLSVTKSERIITNSSINTIGQSINSIASSINTTGVSIDNVGLSIEYKETSLSETGFDLKSVGMLIIN
jgi:type VI secretion system secreted protein VgrG